jgi:hypothetical protein
VLLVVRITGNGVLFFANDPAWLFNDKLNYNVSTCLQTPNHDCLLTSEQDPSGGSHASQHTQSVV